MALYSPYLKSTMPVNRGSTQSNTATKASKKPTKTTKKKVTMSTDF